MPQPDLPAPREAPGGVLTDRDAPAFDVHLENFTGPFDLLLGLISRRRLEITEVALAAVTDDFIAHLRRLLSGGDDGPDGTQDGSRDGSQDRDAAALGQASGFLVVAATLLDLKAARLLPAREDGEPDADDLALLEARDLLFARLLQHRAYAQVGEQLRARLAEGSRGVPRPGGAAGADPDPGRLLPELVWTATADQLAALAGGAFTALAAREDVAAPRVDRDHLHAPTVSVPEQVALLRDRLQALGAATAVPFAALADLTGEQAPPVALVVGRFLAVLELYRRGEADLEQHAAAMPDAPLLVRWSAP